MKTLAELKRTLKPGMTLDTEHLVTGWKPGPRQIALVGTTQFGLLSPDKENRISYCDFGKASEFEVVDENPLTWIFHRPWYVDGQETVVPLLKYTLIGA